VTRDSILIAVMLALSILGAVVKTLGGLLYGSKALFVDALTCFANIVALIAVIYFSKMSLLPPDTDHPYGHYRLGYAGVLITLISYSYVAGIATSSILISERYTVEFNSVIFAVAGFLIYSIVILLSRMLGGHYRSYGIFTVSELVESVVVIIASLGGSLVSYIIDYIGAVILTSYIFYEIYEEGKEMFEMLADTAPPQKFIEITRQAFQKEGFNVLNIRLRRTAYNLIHGDVLIEIDTSKPYGFYEEKFMKIKEELRMKGIEVAIEAVSRSQSQ